MTGIIFWRISLSSMKENVNYLPKSLQRLLQNYVCWQRKRMYNCSIGQAIMQSVRPRCIVAPLQIGLGVQMHRQFGSRFLIDCLHQHGFSSSYSEVQMYERSAAVLHSTDITTHTPDMFLQHVADNVDHQDT